MIKKISNYFAGELTPKEKELFLVEIYNSPEYSELYVSTLQLLALVDFAHREKDEEQGRRCFSLFLQKVN